MAPTYGLTEVRLEVDSAIAESVWVHWKNWFQASMNEAPSLLDGGDTAVGATFGDRCIVMTDEALGIYRRSRTKEYYFMRISDECNAAACSGSKCTADAFTDRWNGNYKAVRLSSSDTNIRTGIAETTAKAEVPKVEDVADAEKQSAASLPIIPIAGGAAALVVMLALLVILKKKKQKDRRKQTGSNKARKYYGAPDYLVDPDYRGPGPSTAALRRPTRKLPRGSGTDRRTTRRVGPGGRAPAVPDSSPAIRSGVQLVRKNSLLQPLGSIGAVGSGQSSSGSKPLIMKVTPRSPSRTPRGLDEA